VLGDLSARCQQQHLIEDRLNMLTLRPNTVFRGIFIQHRWVWQDGYSEHIGYSAAHGQRARSGRLQRIRRQAAESA